MSLLILGLIIFFGTHSISLVNRRWRDQRLMRLGEPAWKGLYSLVSLLGLGLICYGYGAARLAPLILYTPPLWLRHLAFALMLPVFPLMLAVYLPGRLKAAARHPLLLATKLWASAHLLANGALAHVLLFGSFLLWAVADRIAVRGRGESPLVLGPKAMRNDVWAIGLGLLLYGIFIVWLHRLLIGVSPL